MSQTITAKRRLVEVQDDFLDELDEASSPVEFRGTKFVLPRNMTLEGGITFLQAKLDETAGVELNQMFDYRPWDGAAATMRVLERDYGGYAMHSTVDAFTGARIPATKVSVPISLTETVTIPWGGKIAVAALSECLITMGGTDDPDKGMVFTLTVQAPPEMEPEVQKVFAAIQTELAENSLYRGKAFDCADMPNFLDLTTIDPTKVVYSDEVLTQLEANVWSQLRFPQAMENYGLSLKRSVLFEGQYGTGKTLAAYLTALIAEENGWAFIYCRPAEDDIEEALQTARLYEPSVVFFEDLDTIAEAGDKDAMTGLLDAFDGIQNKGTRILTIITTNHVGQIHKGMLRPGRLDAVISTGALDRAGIEKLVLSTVDAACLDGELDFDRLYEACSDMMPAFVREGIGRAIRYGITRNEGEFTTLTTDDFVHAFVGMRPQLALMEQAGDRKDIPTLQEAHSEVIKTEVKSMLAEFITPIYEEFGIRPPDSF